MASRIDFGSTGFQKLDSGERVFFRSAGSVDHPTILLLHGFPSSSHQYRNLIPLLATEFRVIAPDLPGFGFTTVPDTYKHSFRSLTETLRSFLQQIPNPPENYAIYIFDYGAPVGLRLALSNPAAVTAIITQNGNAYEQGLTPFWDPIKRFWTSDDDSDRDFVGTLLQPDAIKMQYEAGSPDNNAIAPETYTLDQALLDRPGNADIQLSLMKDYQSNVKLYPAFQKYFRESKVPVLVVWGANDAIFGKEGALAFLDDVPLAEIHLLDAGHFAVETDFEKIATLMLAFLRG